MNVFELNMDGLVGPTHHYAGLAKGNLASTAHALMPSNPQAAALQGIKKMRLLHTLGLKQAILPPHQRPNLELLRQLGFSGSPSTLLKKADSTFLSAAFSASSMWAANAATTSPSTDTLDGRVHFTTANLLNHLHRHQEASFNHMLLKTLFADEDHFCHHLPLPSTPMTRDEGAANHSRLCQRYGDAGTHLFVYNAQMLPSAQPKHFPARQTLEAQKAIARGHGLNPEKVIYAQQNPVVVDAGVFHNDVIMVANESVLLIHENALLEQEKILSQLQERCKLTVLSVADEEVSVKDAVDSYLFNSQLIRLKDERMCLIAPEECITNPKIKTYIERLIASNQHPIQSVYYLDLKQSMQNGGGPACLRFRVVLNEKELSRMHQGILGEESLFTALEHWVMRHYRTALSLDDLRDPAFIDEVLVALDELTTLLKLRAIYPFQR